MFGIGSALAGAARNIDSLIVFRLLQGAAGGLMIPLMTTIMVTAAGRKRLGRMMTLGLALLSPGLALVIYGLSEASGAGGSAAARAWAPLAAGAVLTVVFALHAWHRADSPLINVRLLRVRTYTASTAVLFLAGLSVYGPLLLPSLYFQDVQAHSAVVTGLLLAPQRVGSLIPRGIAGRLTDRIGSRPVTLVGLLLTAIGTLAFTSVASGCSVPPCCTRRRSGAGHDRRAGPGVP